MTVKTKAKRVLNEEGQTAAAATLAPQAAPGESRAVILSNFTQMLAQLGKEDLTSLYNSTLGATGYQVPTKQTTAPAAKPSSAVGKGALPQMPMVSIGSVQEDINEMFAGQELSEEFKEKASIIFEAAVQARINVELVALQEAFEEAVEANKNEVKTEIEDSVIEYMDYVSEEWLEQNKIAIESSIRSQIAENFMENLYNLFSESYINVPEDKLDVLEDLLGEVDELEQSLDEQINRTLELESIIEAAQKDVVFDELAEGLVMTEVERFRSLAEGIEFSDEETYRKKLNIVKDQYFNKNKTTDTNIIKEETQEDYFEGSSEKPLSDSMNKYVAAISKTAK